MRREIRVFLIVCLVAFASAFVMQGVFQYMGAEKSVWGGNPGWQREIAFWNVGLIVILLAVLRLKDDRLALAVVRGCTVLFLLLGTNHLFAFFADPQAPFHWPPLALNYLGFLAGVRVLWRFGRVQQAAKLA